MDFTRVIGFFRLRCPELCHEGGNCPMGGNEPFFVHRGSWWYKEHAHQVTTGGLYGQCNQRAGQTWLSVWIYPTRPRAESVSCPDTNVKPFGETIPFGSRLPSVKRPNKATLTSQLTQAQGHCDAPWNTASSGFERGATHGPTSATQSPLRTHVVPTQCVTAASQSLTSQGHMTLPMCTPTTQRPLTCAATLHMTPPA